ncbi:GMC oxidoreductase [Neptunicoccus cionae]|uniref:2-keto-gluconate dehydrogenase subunit n=1 Tax=Neptunicoccus cionae TaxID=2035344 RepID=A0A916QQN0_9RHOB|nr:GMC family oxidoreductase [Amylibacter cionae]GGA06053.1 2-keto-gluconate dehydrogenase subunit [Amylibacter cionae]
MIIAGSSFAAMFFLRGLPENLRVLVVEKGGIQLHADQLKNNIRVDEDIAVDNRSGYRKRWKAHTLFGGNSNCWWACTPRFHPNDFKLNSLYGVGVDWPLFYDDLEPLYGEVEQVMEIAGGGSDHILPRSTPFPFPPHAPSRTDVALQAHSTNWFAQPTARSNGGRRAQCCVNGICDLCPVDAKFSVPNSVDLFARDGVSLLLGAEVRAVDVAGAVAQGVLVRDATGAEHLLIGDLIALGTNAIWNAGILLRSGLQSKVLGRYLHEQVAVTVLLDLGAGQKNYYGGTSITGHGYDLYDGAHRAEYGAVLMENHNAPAAIRSEAGRWMERLRLKLIAEDLPVADNRVVLRDDQVITEWGGHTDYAFKALDAAVAKLPEVLPFDIEGQSVSARLISEDHIQGTHRMGVDPARSVIDTELKCHEVRNLLALGAGAFPTGPAANPTLTLSALSLRAGRAV